MTHICVDQRPTSGCHLLHDVCQPGVSKLQLSFQTRLRALEVKDLLLQRLRCWRLAAQGPLLQMRQPHLWLLHVNSFKFPQRLQ